MDAPRTPTIEDRLADFTRDRRLLLLFGMAIVVGAMSAVVVGIEVSLFACPHPL